MVETEFFDLKKGEKPNFPEPESVGERPWGKEELLALISQKYMLKTICKSW